MNKKINEICFILLNVLTTYFNIIFSELILYNFILQIVICYIKIQINSDEDFIHIMVEKLCNILIYVTIIVIIAYFKSRFSFISILINELVKYIVTKYNIFD